MMTIASESVHHAESALQPVKYLTCLRTLILESSSYLVPFPWAFGLLTLTWGAWTFPFIFLLIDLTVRFLDQSVAQRVVRNAMLQPTMLTKDISCL